MSWGAVLLIVLFLVLFAAIPDWPHSRGWGYVPSGSIAGLLLVVVLVMVLSGTP